MWSSGRKNINKILLTILVICIIFLVFIRASELEKQVDAFYKGNRRSETWVAEGQFQLYEPDQPEWNAFANAVAYHCTDFPNLLSHVSEKRGPVLYKTTMWEQVYITVDPKTRLPIEVFFMSQ